MLEVTLQVYYPLYMKGLIHRILPDKNIQLPSFTLKGIKRGTALGFDYSTSSNLLLS